MNMIENFRRGILPFGASGIVLLLVGCAQTIQYPPFPDQTKRVEDPTKARVYVMRGANVLGGGQPVVFFGTDWTATGPVFDPAQKLIIPLIGMFPDNYHRGNELRRVGEVAPHCYICWETPPHLFSIQRIEGDTNTTFTIDMQAGNVYYLRVFSRPGWIEGKSIVEQMSEQEGQSLLKKCKPPNSYRK